MKIIVDTCIWSLAVRRNNIQNNAYINELQELIKEIRVQLIGPVRQELLSGVKSKKQFDLLKTYLEAFDDLELGKENRILLVSGPNAGGKTVLLKQCLMLGLFRMI